MVDLDSDVLGEDGLAGQSERKFHPDIDRLVRNLG